MIRYLFPRLVRCTIASAFILLLMTIPVLAVEPDEMLADPTLEARAQALDEVLRCVQCRSESIASSNADWAKDARLLVRELIEAGQSDEGVLDYFVDRYGEVVLMRPRTGGANMLLWISGPLMLLAALGFAILYFRRRSAGGAAPKPLTADETARLEKLLGE